MTTLIRCDWALGDPLSQAYHDQEWGQPCFDDQRLFEFLILEGAQAGLSWHTVLAKRAHYQKVFERFNPNNVARFNKDKVAKLLQDPGIIRNRLKVNSAIRNAQAFLKLQEEFDGFHNYLWHFVDGQPITNQWHKQEQVPATTPLSDQLSKDLKKRGFNFVGSTIMYAYMQAVGLVNDHLTTCFCHDR